MVRSGRSPWNAHRCAVRPSGRARRQRGGLSGKARISISGSAVTSQPDPGRQRDRLVLAGELDLGENEAGQGPAEHVHVPHGIRMRNPVSGLPKAAARRDEGQQEIADAAREGYSYSVRLAPRRRPFQVNSVRSPARRIRTVFSASV